MKDFYLNNLYDKYKIYSLPYGKVGDKLGDVFEELCIGIFNDKSMISKFISNQINSDYRFNIFKSVMLKSGISQQTQIDSIEATDKIPTRESGGNPKTDILIKVNLSNGTHIKIPVSIKQTTANKVSFAEYDVDTIVREVGITDLELIRLMKKHQEDGSAKNFTKEEKIIMMEKISDIKEDFLRWIITTSIDKDSPDIRFPKIVIKFDINKEDYNIRQYNVFTVDEYINKILYNKNGKPNKGGFGTGLSWTYATGSKGKKIQFKG